MRIQNHMVAEYCFYTTRFQCVRRLYTQTRSSLYANTQLRAHRRAEKKNKEQIKKKKKEIKKKIKK
jgi:cytidylate kinase